MTELERPEQAPEDVPSDAGASIGAKRRRSLSKSRRELTEEELTQSGVRLMLLDEVDRLDGEVTGLQTYEERFHAADKYCAVLQEKMRRNIAIDVVYGVCLGLGVGLLMLSPTLEAVQRWPAVAIGVVLIISGVVTKVLGR